MRPPGVHADGAGRGSLARGLGCRRLDQIVTNLIANALKYGAGSPIELEAQGGEDRSGSPCATTASASRSADQQRIFQRFERAASERHYGGLGLGLWIASELTKGLGGEIAVDSAPGAGAAFTVVLPRRTTETRPTPTSAARARRGPGRRRISAAERA